jgi:SulP family sulfate permease
MIGQSVINVKSGGRGRLSTLAAGVFLLLMVVFLGDWVAQIPMAALVAVMIMVSIGTFNWARSQAARAPAELERGDARHRGGGGGHARPGQGRASSACCCRAFFFAHKVGRCCASDRSLSDDGRTRTYGSSGQVFFASAETLHRRLRLQGGHRARA